MFNRIISLSLLLLASIANTGCSVGPGNERGETAQPAGEPGAITAEEAVAMARSAVDDRGLKYDKGKTRVYWWDGSWWVVFLEDPTVIGGDFTVEVSADGKVIGIERGL